MATNDGVPSTSRTRDRVITESGQRYSEHEQDTDRCDRKSTTIQGRERLFPKSWSISTPLGGFAREVALWLGCIDPKHEAGKNTLRITKGSLRANEAWPDGRHAEDDKYVELDSELAVALVTTEGAARSTVLKVTQVEPSRGFVAWQALVDGYAPKSSNDPAIALQAILARPKRCKDAKDLKERLTAESGRVRAPIRSDR